VRAALLRRLSAAVPVELTERQLRDAIAVIGERHEHGGQAAESALGWLGWEGEGPLLLRRYDVQQFAWYTLPRKFLTDLEDKRQTAELVALTLDRLGDTARAYAEVCRSHDTDELLRAWENEDPAAWQRFRELLDASGLEPPDTDLLAWGRVMGFDEARVRDLIATSLEQAIDDRRLTPGARGFRRVRDEIAEAALLEPWEDDPRRSRLQAVHAERLARWVKRGSARGSAERDAIIEPVLPLLAEEPATVDPVAVRAALEPVLWLLDRAASGIALTQTGALNRALVREVATRWPSWWPADLFGAPNREDDVTLLAELHELLRRLGLLRRTGRRLTATRRARALAADPPALLRALTRPLLADNSFDAACCELAVALIPNDATADYTSSLASHVYPAIIAAGWHADGKPPEREHVSWAIADLLRPAEALCLLEPAPGDTRLRSGPLILSVIGRAALTDALRARALAPVHGPY
jgi:hypothetical protein